jgi:hypothetical protein
MPRPSHFLDFITRTILDAEYRSLSSSVWSCPNIPGTKSLVPLSFPRSYRSVSPGPRPCLWIFRNKDAFSWKGSRTS